MADLSTSFSTYVLCSGRDKVRTIDGSPSPISSKGVVHTSNSLSLSSALHVPYFSTNLLSISRITCDLNCCMTFFPTNCVFQDLSTKKTIGSCRENDGLYFLMPNEGESSGVPRSANHSVRETLPCEAWLWHQRLGHPSFHLLRFLFPSLLNN